MHPPSAADVFGGKTKTMVDRRSSAWLAHSIASANLIQLRGPGVHMTGFDRALLLAHHGLIVRKTPAPFSSLVGIDKS